MTTTKYRLTRYQALALKPCQTSKVPDFNGKRYFTPQDAFNAGVSAEDFLWVLVKTGHKWVAVKMALIYAQKVAHLSADPKVQAAIDAGWKVVRNPTDEAASEAASEAAMVAARAARVAAWAARVAWAAARAASEAAWAAARAASEAAMVAARAASEAAWAASAASEAAWAASGAIRWIDVFEEAIRDEPT